MPDGSVMIFLAFLGASIGSFLNVVAYRLPRGLSIVHPGSSCPFCRRWIRWYDNIPVASYLLLGGKCRHCRTPISPRYTLVEAITALLFVALYDAFFRAGIHGLFFNPSVDWALFLSHLVLLAALVAASAIDIEYYLIDIRIIYIAIFVGFLAWVIQPHLELHEPQIFIPQPSIVLGGLLGAAIGLIFRHLWLIRSIPAEDPLDQESETPETAEKPSQNRFVHFLLIFYALGAVGLIVWSVLDRTDNYPFRGILYVLWAFIAIVAAAIPHRLADQEIVDAIEQEKATARRTSLKELASLLPIVVGFVLGLMFVASVEPVRNFFHQIYSWPFGPFRPMMGITFALWGLLVAAAFGWIVRIGFTLLFGKEAMGVGDIYILAAVGAVAGPFVAIVGFFIGSIIGVFGVLVLSLWKTSRALSYGPWIAIGTLVAWLFYTPIVEYLYPVFTVLEQVFIEQ